MLLPLFSMGCRYSGCSILVGLQPGFLLGFAGSVAGEAVLLGRAILRPRVLVVGRLLVPLLLMQGN